MAVRVSELISLIDKKYRDSSDGTIDENNKFYAIQEILDDMKGEHVFPWEIRTRAVKYYDTLTRYTAPSDFACWIEPEPESRLYNMNLVSPENFNVQNNQGMYEIYADEWRNGELSWRLKTRSAIDKTEVSPLASYDGNGTWAVGNDAVNIGTDVNIFRHNSSSIKFDVDVSASANNYASISVSDMGAVDLSDNEGSSAQIIDFYIPDSTYITGFTMRWGSSSGAYWSKSITTQADGRAFENGWNTLLFDWVDATATGSPSSSAINYGYIQITYSSSQTDMKNCRVNYWRCSPEVSMPVQYGTTNIAKNTNGTYISAIGATTDVMLFSTLYPSMRSVIVYGASAILQDNSMDRQDYLDKNSVYQIKKEKLYTKFPSREKKPLKGTSLYPGTNAY